MSTEDPIKQVEHYAHALKAPRIREAAARLADQAREGGWSHEEYLAAVLSREVAARESSGAATRIRSAGFPTRKSLEEFNFDHQPSLGRDVIAHLGTGAFLAKARNVVLLGPPGTGKTHLAIGLAIKAAHAGHRVAFATAVGTGVPASKPPTTPAHCPLNWSSCVASGSSWSTKSATSRSEQDAANLFFQLVSSRYEHASLILTSNLPFARWGDVFGDQVVAAAMIDRIVHHAEVLTLKGSSYRLKDTGIDTLPSARADNTAQ